MQATEPTNTMVVGEATSDPSLSKPMFSSVNASETFDGQVQTRMISVPANRYRPLKKAWSEIYPLLSENMKIDLNMNPKSLKIMLRTRSDTPDVDNLQKCADFFHAFMLGFRVVDALRLINSDGFHVDSFEIKDVKTLENLSGEAGESRATAIENATITRVLIDGVDIHILGSSANIKMARDTLCRISEALSAKIHSRL